MASARDFGDGERNYYSYAHTAALASPTTEGTLACLIRPKTGSDAFGIPAYKERDASSDRAAYGLVTNNQNWGGFFGEVHNGTTLEGNTPTTAQTLNTWYQLLVTWKSGGNLRTAIMDLDGTVLAEQSEAWNGSVDYGNEGDFTIGSYPRFGVNSFVGEVARVFVDNEEWTDGEVDGLLVDGTYPRDTGVPRIPQFLADDPAQDLISETNGSATGTPAAVTFPPVAALESLTSRGIDMLGMLCDT